jgi:hypothetical protein
MNRLGMNRLGKTCAAALTLLMAAGPAWACVTREDDYALQAATVQQRLMVAALTCHDIEAYNRFVITYRKDLQDSDAQLLAFFQKSSSGTAGYHAYKTRLANSAELNSVRNDNFCRDAHAAFRAVLSDDRDSLQDALARLPQSDTGYDACYRREARDDRSVRARDDADNAPAPRDWRW